MLRRILLSFALSLVIVAVFALPAQGALTLSGGGLQLIQQGGVIAPGNMTSGATLVASPSFVNPSHTIPGLGDQIFGNSNSWLASGTINGVGFAGASFGASPVTVGSFAFGRSNTLSHTDRTLGTYTLQYTQVANPTTALTFTGNAATGWATVGTLNYASAGGALFSTPSLRHRYEFTPVQATGMRLIVPDTTGGPSGTAIDELEFYASPVNHNLSIGQSVTIDESVGLSIVSPAGAVTEPAGGNNQYRYILNSTLGNVAEFYFSPLIQGEDVDVQFSWAVFGNHARDVDIFFDPDGTGPEGEISLQQNIDQRLLADQITTASGVWSGFMTIGTGLDIGPESYFRVTGTNISGTQEALASAMWQFTSTPEPASFVIWGLLGAAGIAVVLRRTRRVAR